MKDSKSLVDVSDLSDDIEYKLEKVNAIVLKINDDMFKADKVPEEAIYPITDEGKQKCANILCEYNTTKLLLEIMKDYIWSAKDLLKEQKEMIDNVQSMLSVAKTVM